MRSLNGSSWTLADVTERQMAVLAQQYGEPLPLIRLALAVGFVARMQDTEYVVLAPAGEAVAPEPEEDGPPTARDGCPVVDLSGAPDLHNTVCRVRVAVDAAGGELPSLDAFLAREETGPEHPGADARPDDQAPSPAVRRFASFASRWVLRSQAPLSHPSLLLAGEGHAPSDGDLLSSVPRVTDQVRAAAERYPDRVAVSCGGISLRYQDLIRNTAQVAQALRDSGAGHGTRVAVELRRGVPTVVALLAILEIGSVYVPLPTTLPPARRRFIATDADVTVLVCDVSPEPVPEREPLPGVTRLELRPEGRPRNHPAVGGPAESGDSRADPDAAYVMYTSGSTGRPKGVLVKASSLATVVEEMTRWFGLTSDDRFLAATTTGFDISLLELLCPLVAGACCHVADDATAQDPALLADFAGRVGTTVLQATPSVWRIFTEHATVRLRLAAAGGEPLAEDLKDNLLKIADEVLNCYGPTETTIWSSVWRAGPGAVRIGSPLKGNSFHILDRWRRPRPPGQPGELWIGGPALASGYLNRPVDTAVSFAEVQFDDGPRLLYRTGDVVSWDPRRGLRIHGRRDAQVKIRGHRVEPGEIEKRILEQPEADSAVVVDHLGPSGGRSLTAFVVPRPDAAVAFDSEELTRRLRDVLPDYMVPARCVLCAALPLLASGKTDRRALAAEASRKTPSDRPAPATSSLRTVVTWVMSEVLGRPLSQEESFFEAGGDSLAAVRVVARLRRWLAVAVKVNDMHAAPSARALAECLRHRLRGEALLLTISATGVAPGVAWLCPSTQDLPGLLGRAVDAGRRRGVWLLLPGDDVRAAAAAWAGLLPEGTVVTVPRTSRDFGLLRELLDTHFQLVVTTGQDRTDDAGGVPSAGHEGGV